MRANSNGTPMTQHILGTFERALQELKEGVLTMASVAQRNLENAVKGLLDRNIELCNEAIAEDDEVNRIEKDIDQLGLEVMMRFQPVAHDLREVISAMKMANNLERISDQAESIARRARKIMRGPEIEETKLVEPIYTLAATILRDSIRAYSQADVELALSLAERDRELDKAHRHIIKQLTRTIEAGTENVKSILQLIFIIRSLERVGDHAVNISEDTVFIESATDIRHGGRKSLTERFGQERSV